MKILNKNLHIKIPRHTKNHIHWLLTYGITRAANLLKNRWNRKIAFHITGTMESSGHRSLYITKRFCNTELTVRFVTVRHHVSSYARLPVADNKFQINIQEDIYEQVTRQALKYHIKE